MQFANHNLIKKTIAALIAQAIHKTFPEAEVVMAEKIYPLLSDTPKADMGDIAFGCFPFAKSLRKAPNMISEAIKENLGESDLIQEAKCFGPYLNFYLNYAAVADLILTKVLDGSFFDQNLMQTAPKTIVEYSQPNTHKEMHVGHMRNLCLGDSLIKLLRYSGVETISTTYPGDVGTHVAKCLWYYKKENLSPPESRKGAWLGTLYTASNSQLEEEKGTDKEDVNRAELTAILKELHAGSGEYYELWKETRQWSLELMQKLYSWADVSFDHWYWESEVDADSVKLVKEYLDKGLLVKDQGAVGMDLSDDKLGFCLLLKSDGTGLYATKDLELARRKFQDHKVEQSIYVVDNRQSLHFKQVFKVLEKIGFEQAKDCHHLQYEMVELPDGAMSSRKGNIVPIEKLIDQMEQKIKEDYLARYKDEWEQSEVDEVAHIVASGAIKYGMTSIDSNKKIVFDMDKWLKLDGESGPYIQYACARINSLVAKINVEGTADYSLLTNPLEKDLIKKISNFNSVIQTSVEQYKTHVLCTYLYELAKSFSSFYAECSLANASSEELKLSRANLSKAVSKTLSEGLSLLGIKAPKRM